ncbi:MAG: CubicO group peptidase (beta-lactamase class C family)/beta-glucosidase-like glycosyl hydrolase [Saprospiraceae bacterium]|jgi:CubicO group peptidase (beta-lactamase class C family)/beta-glucosidase-like glycosyl hydrolase
MEETTFLNVSTTEIDSLLQVLTIEEKVGQLILFEPDFTKKDLQPTINHLVEENRVGGFLLKNLPLLKYAKVSDSLKIASDLPLFFATDAPISLHNQFSDMAHFPKLISLDAVDSVKIKRELEQHFIDQCKGLGINLCLAPNLQKAEAEGLNAATDYDFQDTKINRTAIRKIAQLQENHILTIGDSFSDLWYVDRDSTGYLDSILFPYQMPIAAGLAGMMVDESIFAIDTFQQLPTFFIKNYLDKQLDFKGLIVSKHTERDSLEKLFHAGTDLYITQDYQATFDFLMAFAEQGILTKKNLDDKVRKILQAKTWTNRGQLFSPEQLEKKRVVAAKLIKKRITFELPSKMLIGKKKYALKEYFKNPAWHYLTRNLYEKSIIVANNHDDLLPYKKINGQDFRILQFGNDYLREFEKYFGKYAAFSHKLFKTGWDEDLEALKIKSYQYVTPVLILDNIDLELAKNEAFINSINELSKLTPTTLINFGAAENLAFFDETVTVIQIFESNKFTESLTAQLLFGAVEGFGRIPNTVSEQMVAGTSNPIKTIRMKYAPPEEVGIAKARLSGIEALINGAIKAYATPGGQVVVAKEGKIIYSKSFGHHTYQGRQSVENNDLYDLASLTKPAATTLMGMKLYEQNRIKITDPIKKISPQFEGTAVGWIRMRDLFTHRSGLQSHMPIGRYISRKDTTHALCNKYFCKTKRDSFSIKITEDLYFHEEFRQKIQDDVSKLKKDRRRRGFRYSDVNFNLIQRILEDKSNQKLDAYVYENFYEPMGLRHMRFNPLEKFSKYQIAPTQNDMHWRKQILRGYVHDETAALLGGVSGNAGLFSNGEDMAVLFQMLLDDGVYGGVQYLKPKTVKYFTSTGHGNHRGLGFDKPSSRKIIHYGRSASKSTFGHTGFTGTCVWADPEHDLVFVFLNNRIHPNVHNKNLNKRKTRSRIHQVVYEALETFDYTLPELHLEGESG